MVGVLMTHVELHGPGLLDRRCFAPMPGIEVAVVFLRQDLNNQFTFLLPFIKLGCGSIWTWDKARHDTSHQQLSESLSGGAFDS